MSRMNNLMMLYDEAASESGLSDEKKDVFMSFMYLRFGTFDLAYAKEWADRFKTSNPERYMDNDSLSVYNLLLSQAAVKKINSLT